jgi:hypothetical protein
MEPTCRYGDVHCLTRYTADQVAAAASALLDRTTDGRGRVIYPASLHSMTITQLPSPSTTHNPPL